MSYRQKPDISAVPSIPDHIYYDVLISNFNSNTGAPIPIYFNENRTNPIVPVTGEYEMSIIRFSVDTTDLPVFIPVITPGSDSVNGTNYFVTMSILPVGSAITYVVQTPIIWKTQDDSADIPLPPSQTGTGYQSTYGNYYYCYNYQHWAALVFAAFQSCFKELQATIATALYTDLVNVLPPIISWDTGTNCAVISVPQFNNLGNPCFDTRYLDFTTGDIIVNTHGVKIYFNSPLFQLFNSYNNTFQGVGNVITGTGFINTFIAGTYTYTAATSFPYTDYILTVLNDGGTNQILIPNIYPQLYAPTAVPPDLRSLYLQVFQEYSTTINWTPVSSIVFVSNTLPIVSNQLASPVIFNENQIITGNGNNANFAQIITDIESNDQSYKPNLLYNPLAEYRMISMTGNRPLTNVDISVFWKTKLGNLIPLNLLTGGSCSVKFLFRKRIV